ncbi:MAG TPA: sulfatase-like hydrolase/transferase, partial [Candidatus Tripitaka californicus]|uniref:sulfatase-like hydrolase/transferase n=1 Tax=Candidatus Tripitaka californicus TaxID=3367616 RepID=UPI004028CFD7
VFSGLSIGKGHLQEAVYLNGVDSYLQTPLTFNGWQELTISLWVMPEEAPSRGSLSDILDVGHTTAERCALQLDNSTQTVDWHYAGGDVVFKLPSDTWSYLVLTADNKEKKIQAYRNGIKMGESVMIGEPKFDDTPLTFGRMAKADARYFKGAIDEVTVFDRPMNTEETRRLYCYYMEKVGVRQEVLEVLGELKQTKETISQETGALKSRVGALEQEVSVTSERVDSAVTQLGEQIKASTEAISQQKEVLASRVGALEQKIDGTTARVDSTVAQVGELRRLYDLSIINQPPAKDTPRPNVIMIVSDTLRADHVSAINPRAEYRTPNIDSLAEMGVLFRNAIAQGPFTRSSMGSVFTGLYPSEHKAYEGLLPGQRNKNDMQVARNIGSFLDRLRASGYGTYMVSQNYNPSDHGIPITTIFSSDPRPKNDIDAKPKTAIDYTVDFIKTATSPYFLYLHIIDPHDPYDNALDIDPTLPPRQIKSPASSYEDSITVNDARLEYRKHCLEIVGVDRELGRLIDCLRDRDYFKDNVLIFFGDHGEYFNERPELHSAERPMDKLFPYAHGFDLHQEQIHVPLILVTPTIHKKGIVVDQFVEIRALFFTIPELAGSGSINDEIHPQSLMPLILNGEKGGYCISEGIASTTKNTKFNVPPFSVEQKSIISPDGLKLIYNTLYGTCTLYDLKSDPAELHPLDPNENEGRILELRCALANRIDIDADFIRPEPYEHILSMPQNRMVARINATCFNGDHFPAYALDEDPNTSWQVNSDSPLPVHLTLTLKNPARIEQLRIKPRPDNPQWLRKADLLASDDGCTWEKVADILVTACSTEEKAWEISVDRCYKYYRLNITEPFYAQQNTISIAEVRLVLKDSDKLALKDLR